MRSTLIDISRRLHQGFPAWPGDPDYRREQRVEQCEGRSCRISSLQLGAHLGTHLDAPAHLSSSDAAATVDEIELEVLIGPARVIDARGVQAIGPDLIQALPDCPPRLLFRTDNSARPYSVESFVNLTLPAAEALVSRACLLIGIDGPSPDPAASQELPVHARLLEAGVVIVEGLDLHAVSPGDYELICLPLPLLGAEAAPARAVLRRLS